MYAVSASSGEKIWSLKTGVTYFKSPTVVEDRVYFGSSTDLHAVDASSGDILWSFDEGGSTSSPVIVDGTIYFGSTDGNLYAVEAGVAGSSEDSRVLQGVLGHHHVFAERGHTQPDTNQPSILEVRASRLKRRVQSLESSYSNLLERAK